MPRTVPRTPRCLALCKDPVKAANNELTLKKRLTVTPSEIDHSSLKFGRKFFSDVNECKVDLHKCHSDTNCENAEGSYNCTCKPEYI